MVSISKAIVGRIALIVAMAIAAFALPASAASAAGTLKVTISGAGKVSGGKIDCARDVGDKDQSGTCEEEIEDVKECDPERKPPCILVPGTAIISADGISGFAFDHWTGACASAPGPTCLVEVTRNVSATAVFRDATNPTVALAQPGAGPVSGNLSLSASASDNVSVSRVDFKVRGAVVASDTTPPYAATFDTKTIADGLASVTATAVDSSGLAATTANVNVTIDNTKPALTVNGPNGVTFGPGTTQNWTLAASDAGGTGIAQVRCSLVASGAAPSFGACSGGNAHSATGKPHGSYVLTVRATDNAGNATDVVRTFAIDAVAPETTITSGVEDGATTTSTSLTWAMSSSEAGSTFECRVYPAALTPGAFAPCSAGAAHTATGFAPGVYAFEVRATDAVGNVESTPVKRTFTVTNAPPPPPVIDNPGGPAPSVGGAAVTTTQSASAGGAQIVVTLAFSFSNATSKSTKLTRLVVKNVPAGSTVTAKCKKGCAKKSFTKKNASGQVSLSALIKKKRLKVNTTITVVISKPGMGSAVKILKIRARKSPKLTAQCQPVGAPKPTAC
ncbi:MAG TPA: Ig-like domain-containing protein [Solirubrobacter sp.]|nr:Ig-like domain-containing protein [Solirubrobacter sp.]